MRHFFNIEFKFLKQCLFIGFLILLPQILAELFFTHIIWNISFSVVSTGLITGYIYYLFNRVKTDVEYISDKVAITSILSFLLPPVAIFVFPSCVSIDFGNAS